VPYFWVFRSCGEVEALDGVLVVAGEVVWLQETVIQLAWKGSLA
jgi:hypothetical protein